MKIYVSKFDFDINEAYRLSWDDKYSELCKEQNKNKENIVRFGMDMPVIKGEF